MKRVLSAPIAYALAMAFVEATVVIYLRALGHAGPSLVSALPILPHPIVLIEVAREAATMVMLAAVAIAAGRSGSERWLLFFLMFAVWDIGYYGWLWTLVRWPPSLFTWDVLFLIPVPWMGPVLAPVLVSVGMVIASLSLLRRLDRGERLRFSPWTLLGLALGLLIALAAFVVDYRIALAGREPAMFHWGWFATGLTLSAAALVGLNPRARRSPGTAIRR